jgi:hypothetical protein
MTSEELKQEFESALIKHLHFKSKLRSFLYGNGLVEGPLRDPEQCGFGLWIASRVRKDYAHLPEARRLDEEHVRIHQEANRLMDLHQAGQLEEAIAGFPAVQRIADEMVTLLRTIEEKLRTGA